MISFFTIPKAFSGHDGVIQRNAIRSWTRLRPECQVLVLGDESGTRETAAELGAESIPDIEVNDLGTPLLSSAFDVAKRHAHHRLLCYVNADIILLSDFMDAARIVSAAKSRFLMIGQRCNLDVAENLVMDGENWEVELEDRARRDGELYGPHGIDYFLFTADSLDALPPFAVGRPAWDNWMIYRARRQRIPVVDATATTLVIHQNHGYGHIKSGTGIAWEGLEADRNRVLLGAGEFLFTLRDATHRLTPDGLARAWRAGDLKRRVEAGIILAPPVVLRSMRAVRSVARRLLRRRR